jgi:PKHD-type hydroxylase
MDTYNWFINNPQVEEYWAHCPILSKEQCEDIIKLGTSLQLEDGTTGGENPNEKNIRKSRISWIPSSNPDNHWIFRECSNLVTIINNRYFNYDLVYIENLQFTEYNGDVNNPAHYGKHVDTQYMNNGSRKLSFSILLSDETSYEGGDLLLHLAHEPTVPPKTQGNAIVFPSNTLHEVTPVTKGTRYSLVGWVVGPRFK